MVLKSAAALVHTRFEGTLGSFTFIPPESVDRFRVDRALSAGDPSVGILPRLMRHDCSRSLCRCALAGLVFKQSVVVACKCGKNSRPEHDRSGPYRRAGPDVYVACLPAFLKAHLRVRTRLSRSCRRLSMWTPSGISSAVVSLQPWRVAFVVGEAYRCQRRRGDRGSMESRMESRVEAASCWIRGVGGMC